MGLADNGNFLPLEVVATGRVIDCSVLLDEVASGRSIDCTSLCDVDLTLSTSHPFSLCIIRLGHFQFQKRLTVVGLLEERQASF